MWFFCDPTILLLGIVSRKWMDSSQKDLYDGIQKIFFHNSSNKQYAHQQKSRNRLWYIMQWRATQLFTKIYKLLIFIITLMNLKNIVLNERSQTQRIHMFPLNEVQNGKKQTMVSMGTVVTSVAWEWYYPNERIIWC